MFFFRYLNEQKASNKTSYLRNTLTVPVSTVRQQVQVVWDQTETVKNTIKDNYNEFQDRTACKQNISYKNLNTHITWTAVITI